MLPVPLGPPAGPSSPALPGLAPGSERPTGTSQLLNPGWWGRTHARIQGWEGAQRGRRISHRGCKTRGSGQHRPGPPHPCPELGLPAPLTSLTPSANPPQTSQGELPAKAQERRPQKLAGVCRRSLPAGCCLSRRSCSIRPPKPAAGRNRRKVAWVRGGADTIRSPLT